MNSTLLKIINETKRFPMLSQDNVEFLVKKAFEAGVREAIESQIFKNDLELHRDYINDRVNYLKEKNGL